MAGVNIRKRIGNDLLVSFDVRTNGELLPLEGRPLVLELVHEYGERTRVPFSVSGSSVSFHFRGREQRRTGCYYMTLWENLGSDGQAVVDTCEGFTLVPKSCQESDGGAGGLEVESIDLGTVSLEVGVKGDAAYETWLKDGHEGTEEDFLAWLRQPAVDAAAAALVSAKMAEDAAGLAGKAISDIGTTEAEIEHAETLRSEAEEVRNKTEASRISAEEARSTAEQQRQAATEKAIRNADTATLKAMQASEEANKGAENVRNALNELEDANFITAEETRDIESPGGVILANALLKVKQVLTKEEMSVIEKNLTGGGTYMRPLFEAAGAVYNESTGYYELYAKEGGLTDLTESDMLNTFIYSMALYNTNNWELAMYNNKTIRTNIVAADRSAIGGIGPEDNGYNLGGFCRDCSTIEVVRVVEQCYPKSFRQAFSRCSNLKTVIGVINLMKNSSQNAFNGCSKLTNIRIRRLSASISFSDSPLLSTESILYMIQNSEAKSAITITLHPEAFARAVSDADIQAALVQKELVSLVQAEV